MSTTPIVYLSSDPGAPQLTGQVGSLVALLDAVLVNGYGVGINAKTPAGWSIAFTGTNKRVYRVDPVIGSGTYFRVDDSNAVAGSNARAAYVRAFEAMTGIDTGVNGCPTVEQMSDGDTWSKSSALSSAARDWMIVASAKWFYLFVDVNGGGMSTTVPFIAGDMDSFAPGDRYCFMVSTGLLGAAHSGAASVTVSQALYGRNQLNNAVTANQGGYIMRGRVGSPGAVPIALPVPRIVGATPVAAVYGGAGGAYPSTVNNGIFCDDILFREGGSLVRGRMPNCYAPWHDRPLGDLEVKDGLTGFGGATVIAKSYRALTSSGSNAGQVLFDISTPVA